MQTIPYNKNYLGLAQDDYLTEQGQYIESYNIDTLDNGFGAVLGPKSNKLVLTGGKAVTGIYGNYYIANGNIYTFTSSDNVPDITITSADTAYFNIDNITYYYPYYYISGYKTTGLYAIHKCSNPLDKTTYTFDDRILTSSMATIPRFYTYNNLLYILNGGYITRYDGSTYTDITGLRGGTIVGLTFHGTRVYVYQQYNNGTGRLLVWDGNTTTSADMLITLPYIPSYVGINGDYDLISTTTGEIYLMGGIQSKLLFKGKDYRNNSFNGISEKITNFKTNSNYYNNTFELNHNFTYIAGNGDTSVGFYKYGNIIPGIKPSLSKVIGNISDNTNISEITCIKYNESSNTMYYGYKDINGIYGIEYIDFNSGTKQTNGYLVYPIERIPNRIHKELTIRITTSNTSGVKAIKLYKRLDGGDKVLIRTINDIDDTIQRHKITTENEKFITKQLLVEFINPNGDINGPILHGLEFDFKIIEN